MFAADTKDLNSRPLIEKKRRAPRTWPCPICGVRGRRERTRTFRVQHLAHQRVVFWEVTVGVYRSKCKCRRLIMREVNGRQMPVRKRVRYFTSMVDGVALGAGYTDAVRQKVVDLVVRDRLPNSLVREHLKEDFCLEVSEGFTYLCLDWAQKGAA